MDPDDAASARRELFKEEFGRPVSMKLEEKFASKAALSIIEEEWRDRQVFLESKGYILRPRLRPSWIPSWTAIGGKPWKFRRFDPFTCK